LTKSHRACLRSAAGFDQRGHGLSDRAERIEDYTRESMVADLECAIRELGLERTVVIGHSMGGMNAMTFAARHPELVGALVLVDVGPEVSVDGAREVSSFVAGPYASTRSTTGSSTRTATTRGARRSASARGSRSR
jgi:pimeloyl-ACP methyl ester carboxylesterase